MTRRLSWLYMPLSLRLRLLLVNLTVMGITLLSVTLISDHYKAQVFLTRLSKLGVQPNHLPGNFSYTTIVDLFHQVNNEGTWPALFMRGGRRWINESKLLKVESTLN